MDALDCSYAALLGLTEDEPTRWEIVSEMLNVRSRKPRFSGPNLSSFMAYELLVPMTDDRESLLEIADQAVEDETLTDAETGMILGAVARKVNG